MAFSIHKVTLCSLAAVALSGTGSAQIHRVEKPDSVTRAVAVYEYTGDLTKPTSGRLIPVSLFLGGHFEDAGTYLSRPVPLAIQGGTAYQFQRSGVLAGQLDLVFARDTRQNTADLPSGYDNGWFGYGRILPPKPPTTETANKKPGKSTGHAYEVQDDGKPHFGSRPDAPAPGTRAPDPDPSEDRADKVSLPSDRDPNSPDPDRPTLRRTASQPQQSGSGRKKNERETASVEQTPRDPSSDTERPTLKRKDSNAPDNDGIPPDPSELGQKTAAKKPSSSDDSEDIASVSPSGAIPNAGDRPGLHRGIPKGQVAEPGKANAPSTAPGNSAASTALTVSPSKPELKLAVAVSDAKDRPEHDFAWHFDSEADRQRALAGMRALALEVLARPALATDAPEFTKNAPPAAATSASVDRTNGAAGGATRSAMSARSVRTPSRARAGHASSVAKTPGNGAGPLQDEAFSAYKLSLGAPPTFVFAARTTTTPVRYVTVVAQADAEGKLKVMMRSTTDDSQLDLVPRYRLVDAVDPDASNRASLLMEVRGSHERQFALYRLLGSKPEQIFETGTTR